MYICTYAYIHPQTLNEFILWSLDKTENIFYTLEETENKDTLLHVLIEYNASTLS